MAPTTRYTPLGDEKPRTSLSSGDDSETDGMLHGSAAIQHKPKSRLRRMLPLILHGSSILLCTVLLGLAYRTRQFDRRECFKNMYQPSPVWDAIDHEFVDIRFKGSLEYRSPYKGPPTPEVNAAWKELNRYGVISVTGDEIVAAGGNLTAVKFPDDVAGGGYLAVAMGTHHLHCLHWLWQAHYVDYFEDFQMYRDTVPEMFSKHFEHCIDYLRQGIMCNFDAGLIPYNWVLDKDQPTPNANTMHKCVDWEKTNGWLKDRSIDIPEGYEWTQPPDAYSLDWNP